MFPALTIDAWAVGAGTKLRRRLSHAVGMLADGVRERVEGDIGSGVGGFKGRGRASPLLKFASHIREERHMRRGRIPLAAAK